MTKLRHQVTDDGVVIVTLSNALGPIGSGKVEASEARRFAWALLADLDDEDEAPDEINRLCGIRALLQSSPAEARALHILMRHAGRVVSNQAVYEAVTLRESTLKIVDVYIHRLRASLARLGEPGVIATITGIGRRIDKAASDRIAKLIDTATFGDALKTMDGTQAIDLPGPFEGVRLVPSASLGVSLEKPATARTAHQTR